MLTKTRRHITMYIVYLPVQNAWFRGLNETPRISVEKYLAFYYRNYILPFSASVARL
jgi:hypothetical protein